MSSRFAASLGLCSLIFVVGLVAIHLGTQIIAEQVPHPPPELRDSVPDPVEQSEAPKPTVSFVAVGDIMLARTVDERMEKHSMDYPFARMLELTQSADFAFGNLETPIIEGRDVEANEMVFRADPGVENELSKAGFRVLSLANNHSPNFSSAGLLRTFELLEEANIAYAGAGKNAVAARQPAILERGGLSIAFLAYNDTDVVPDSYSAESERPGTVFMDIDPMKADVAMAKNLADLVIVSMHSGTEYQSTPNRRQEEFARAAVDAGADLIIGHHPHVVQTVERYHGKYIVYSLGNFIFDQMWSRETREGMTLRVTMDGSGVTDLQFIPVVIDDYAQPRPATAVEAEPILKRLGVELDSEGRIAQST